MALLHAENRHALTGLLAIWLLLLGSLAGYLYQDYRHVVARNQHQLEQRTSMVNAHLSSEFSTLNRILQHSLDTIARTPEAQWSQLGPELVSHRKLHPALTRLSLVNLDMGSVLISSHEPARDAINPACMQKIMQAAQAPNVHFCSTAAVSIHEPGKLFLLYGLPGEQLQTHHLLAAEVNTRSFIEPLKAAHYAPGMLSWLRHGDNLISSSAIDDPAARPAIKLEQHPDGLQASSPLLLETPDAPQLMSTALHLPQSYLYSLWLNKSSWILALSLFGGSLISLLFFWQARQNLVRLQQRQQQDRIKADNLQRWQAVIELTGLGPWEVNLSTEHNSFPTHWATSLGYGPDEIGNSMDDWRNLIHPDDRQAPKEALQHYKNQQNTRYESIYRLRRKCGTYTWILDRGRALDAANPQHLIGVHIDIDALHQEQHRLQQLTQNIPGAIFQYHHTPDGALAFEYTSQDLTPLFGHDIQFLNNLSSFYASIHSEDRERVKHTWLESANALTYWQQQYRLHLPDGRIRWMEACANPVREESGRVVWYGFAQDISRQQEHFQQLKQTEELQRHLLNQLPFAVAIVDENKIFSFRNQTFIDMFPLPNPGIAALEDWWNNCYPDPLFREQTRFLWEEETQRMFAENRMIEEQDFSIMMRDGQYRQIGISAHPMDNHILVIFREKEQQNKELSLLRDLAFQDSLTQLPNRRAFDRALESEWRHCRRTAKPLTLLMIDIDHFKAFNDLYGHQAGDHSLNQVAAVLLELPRRSHDLTARYGGEEFVWMLPETDLDSACELALKLCQAIEALQIPHAGSSTAPCLTISIGAASLVPSAAVDSNRLINLADRALYKAKNAGRNQVSCQYSSEQSV